MLQQDSIHTPQGGADSVVRHQPITPATVLKWLPRDATPAQQDSAIQAHFQPDEIHWSEQPDTLHLPGHSKGVDLTHVEMPQYYREGFFSKDSLFHPELEGGRYGVAGDPVPYNVRNDNVITSLLLAFFILMVIAIANARRFISRQAKVFLYLPHEGTTEFTETANEMRFQLFLVVLTSLLLALLYYFFTTHFVADTFILESQYQLIAIFFGMFVGYFLVKMLLYTVVNGVFFGLKRNGQWMKSLLFIISLEGVLLFPAILLQAYFDLEMQKVAIYCAGVLILMKMLTIYKCYIIFFRQNVFPLQIFLYFCALEMIPLFAFWGALVTTGNYLKINF